MEIRDFADMREFENLLANWAAATGLAAAAVGVDGKNITGYYNDTDFCTRLTRGSAEGRTRCEKCDKQGHGVHHCHAGLIEFNIPLELEGEKVGTVIGGQILPAEPDEERFRQIAREIGVSEEQYIRALHKVNVRSEAAIKASVELLGQVLNNFINAEYAKKKNSVIIDKLEKGTVATRDMVRRITDKTAELKDLQSKQKILALNASIEAARAGEKGAGFAVVAKEVGKLSEQSTVVNREIEEIVEKITEAVEEMEN